MFVKLSPVKGAYSSGFLQERRGKEELFGRKSALTFSINVATCFVKNYANIAGCKDFVLSVKNFLH